MDLYLLQDPLGTSPSAIEIQKQRYGERLYEKNPKTGTYRCFFCNKELRANFSRHIARHELEGDLVDEDLKQQILKELPQPAPATKNPNESPNAPKKKDDHGGMFSNIKALSYIQSHPLIHSNLTIRHQLEQQFTQILYYFIRHSPDQLLYTTVVSKFLAAAEQQITVPNHTQLSSFYATLVHIAKQIVLQNGNRPNELEILSEILLGLQRGYREELSKLVLQRQQRYRASCSICLEGPSATIPLVPCNGDCVRTFHLSCAITSPNIHVFQISPKSAGWIALCSDCNQGRKVLRWDPFRKQHFFIEFRHDIDPSQPLPVNPPAVQSIPSLPGGIPGSHPQEAHASSVPGIVEVQLDSSSRIERGAAREITLIVNDSEKKPDTPQSVSEIPFELPLTEKKKIREEAENNRKNMYYDPYWCCWREKPSTQQEPITLLAGEKLWPTEPPAKRKKLNTETFF